MNDDRYTDDWLREIEERRQERLKNDSEYRAAQEAREAEIQRNRQAAEHEARRAAEWRQRQVRFRWVRTGSGKMRKERY